MRGLCDPSSDLLRRPPSPARGEGAPKAYCGAGWAEPGVSVVAGTLEPAAVATPPAARPAILEARAKFHARPELAMAFAAPESETERQITDIWSAVLGIDQIGRNDDLTGLGGDSLIAIQLTARLKAAFQVNLSVRMLLEDGTVAAVARRLDLLRWHGEGSPAEAVGEDEEEGEL